LGCLAACTNGIADAPNIIGRDLRDDFPFQRREVDEAGRASVGSDSVRAIVRATGSLTGTTPSRAA
jgi:hypothetical protein